MTTNASRVVQFLRGTDLGEADLVNDPELNRLIDRDMRLTGPFPLKCTRPRCNTTIAYWALSSTDARVIVGPERRPRGEAAKGIYDVEHDPYLPAIIDQPDTMVAGGAVDLLYPGLDHSGRFEPHIEWAMRPDTSINLLTDPDVKAPLVLRFGFTCPACGAADQYTNSTMLRLYARALALRKQEIRPGRM